MTDPYLHKTHDDPGLILGAWDHTVIRHGRRCDLAGQLRRFVDRCGQGLSTRTGLPASSVARTRLKRVAAGVAIAKAPTAGSAGTCS